MLERLATGTSIRWSGKRALEVHRVKTLDRNGCVNWLIYFFFHQYYDPEHTENKNFAFELGI